jgi:hypothetical protein
MSELGLGCVKTPTFNLRVEIPSRFRKFESQKCLRPPLREDDRENNSAYSWLVHVFTQPGSKAEVAAFPNQVRCSLNNGHIPRRAARLCQQRTFTNAPAQARGHLKVPISVHPRRTLGRCTNSCASSQRWSRSRPSCNGFFGRFTATRRPWMDLENTAAIFAAAAKKAHSVAATVESIQSVDFGSGVELGRVLINPRQPAAQSGRIVAFKPRAVWNDHERCSLICLCGKEAEA